MSELTDREGKDLINNQKVNLMYRPIVGAEVDDVALWPEISTKVADDLRVFLKCRKLTSIEQGESHQLTGPKCKSEANDEVRKALARARKFLAQRGIDCAAPIHREDAARFMVEFSLLEKELSEELRLAQKAMYDNYDALRKLADS